MPHAYESESGGVQVLYYLATSSEPETAKDLADEMDAEEKNVHSSLIRLWRSGMVVRRRRPIPGRPEATHPYEYAIAARPEDENNGD